MKNSRSKNRPIGMILDERGSRQIQQNLLAHANALRGIAPLDLIKGDISEEQMLKRLDKINYQLLLAPWPLYTQWSKVESKFGLNRNRGAHFVGFQAEPLDWSQPKMPVNPDRTLFLDFYYGKPKESKILIQALCHETTRFGIQPLLQPETSIYFAEWTFDLSPGDCLEATMALPLLQHPDWVQRCNQLRTCIIAMSSLIYDRGGKKSDLSKSISPKKLVGHFQAASDHQVLVMRLCFTRDQIAAKELLAGVVPKVERSDSPFQFLIRHSDFVRLNHVTDSNELELVVGFFKKTRSERPLTSISSLWVDPIHPELVREHPQATEDPRYRKVEIRSHVQSSASPENTIPKPTTVGEEALKSMERRLQESLSQVRHLKLEIMDKEETISELKSGGLGHQDDQPPPDPLALAEAISERCLDAIDQIQSLKARIPTLMKDEMRTLKIARINDQINEIREEQRRVYHVLQKTMQLFEHLNSNPLKKAG